MGNFFSHTEKLSAWRHFGMAAWRDGGISVFRSRSHGGGAAGLFRKAAFRPAQALRSARPSQHFDISSLFSRLFLWKMLIFAP